ncbi:MAG: hypothetical protein ACPGVT_11255 [Maricaulaceae bacterium]
MPVAIIVTNNPIPSIIEKATYDELMAAIKVTSGVPYGQSDELILGWLKCRPRPTGIYASRQAAIDATSDTIDIRMRPILPLNPNEIALARKRLGLTRVQFGQLLGFNGNDNTVNKAVYEIETDYTKTLNRERQETLFGLMAKYELELKENLDGHVYVAGGVDPYTMEKSGPTISVRTRDVTPHKHP